MTEPDEPEAEAKPVTYEIIPAFTPVPRLKDRSNGWNPDVQRRFVEALADTGSVTSACRTVRRADHGAYQLRRHPEAAEFRRAWDAALDIAVRRIEDGAMDRAINGVQVPVYSNGEVVGWRTQHNERLTSLILQARLPERFGGMRRHQGAKGDNAVDKMELNRLKKQWRKDWEAERYQESADRARQGGDAMIEEITRRHLRWWAHLSPRAKAAYLDFRRIESEDRHCYDHGEPMELEEAEAALADYHESFAGDDRAKIDLMIEADGLADEKVLGDDLPPPPPGRTITIKDGGWVRFDPRDNDGRAREWP